jgi:hypothetical protein
MRRARSTAGDRRGARQVVDEEHGRRRERSMVGRQGAPQALEEEGVTPFPYVHPVMQ